MSKTQVARRLKKLENHDLVIHIGNGAYIITEEGEGYLDEEYDADAGVWIDENHGEEGGPSAGDTPTGPTGPNGAG